MNKDAYNIAEASTRRFDETTSAVYLIIIIGSEGGDGGFWLWVVNVIVTVRILVRLGF